MLVSPTTNRDATKIAWTSCNCRPDRHREAIFTALQAIATVGAVIGGAGGSEEDRLPGHHRADV